MFERLKKKLAEMTQRPAVDPSQFNDPVAEQTEWTPLKPGGTNFRTHKLVHVRPERMEFKATLGMKLFALIFAVAGVGVFVLAVARALGGADDPLAGMILLFVFGSVFTLVGGLLYFFAVKPRVFDKSAKYFWKGRKSPLASLPGDVSDKWVPLDDIHAVQVITEYVSGSKSSYYSHELNLIGKDGKRTAVVDHGNGRKLRRDAQAVAEFLSVPLWDPWAAA